MSELTQAQADSLSERLNAANEELERCVVNAVNICAHVGGMGVDEIERARHPAQGPTQIADYGKAPGLVEAAHGALWAAIVKVAEIIRELRPHSGIRGWHVRFQAAHGEARNAVGLLRALEGVAEAVSTHHRRCHVTRASAHVYWLVDGAAGYGGWRAPLHHEPSF